MEKSNTNRQRNQLFLHLFGFASFLHLLLNAAVPFIAAFYAPLFGLLSYLLLVFFNRFKMKDRNIQILILLAINIYVFILNLESLSAITLIYFVVPIIASALYNDAVPILILALATSVEVLLLTFVFGELERSAPLQYNQLSIFTFIGIILLMAFLHTIYFSRLWRQMEMKNASMEKALISKEGYLQLFFETAKDAIAVFDSNNKIIAINPAFEELYGWSSEESIGKSLKLYPPEDDEAAVYRTKQVQRGESFSLLETQDIKKDGTRFHAQITLSPIFDSAGTIVATSIISRDISYRKEAEKVLLQSEKLKLAGEIAAGVAHEIRNPMTVISGFVQMLHHDPKHLYPEYTKLIQSELERINLIISEFLVLAKPQASISSEISLRNLLNDVTLLFQPEFNLKSIVFSEIWQEEDFIVEAEEHHLKQVFINLLKNAVEASGENGKITLKVGLENNSSISITFNDNGSGISADKIEKIFEPFYTTKASGTGLGLMISQKIVREYGGTLRIESEAGKGTSANVVLPAIKKGAV